MKMFLLISLFAILINIEAQESSIMWQKPMHLNDIRIPGDRYLLIQKCLETEDSVVNNRYAGFKKAFLGEDQIGPVEFSYLIKDTTINKVLIINKKRKNDKALTCFVNERLPVCDEKEKLRGIKNITEYYSCINDKTIIVRIEKKKNLIITIEEKPNE